MAKEIELKLRISVADIPRLKRHPALKMAQAARARTRMFYSIYYDTQQLSLLDNGLSLRLRRVSGKWRQTIKYQGTSLAGLHNRQELETELTHQQIDITNLQQPKLKHLLTELLSKQSLKPLFKTDVKRTEWQLCFDNGDQVEMVLDQGQLKTEHQSEPISEIELELKSGHVGRLFEFASALQTTIPLAVENKSKAERGYGYYKKKKPGICKIMPAKLKRNMSGHLAFKQILWQCLEQLQGNLDMVLHGNDIEGLHQMRIALRRMRSAFNVFRQLADKPSRKKLEQEVAWLIKVLGEARDLDVFISQTMPPLVEQLQQPCLNLLVEQAEQAKISTYKTIRKVLQSPRYHHFILMLADWVENERWRSESSEELTVCDISQTMLTKRYTQLKQRGKKLKKATAKQRHQTRIAAKKLRYVSQFFAEFYPQKKTKPFLKSLAKLQDELGQINDIAVTEGLVTKLLGNKPDLALIEAQYLLKGWNGYKNERCLSHVNKTWSQFVKQAIFWH